MVSFRAWIYVFINSVPSVFSRPARAIADRLFGILDDGIKFARWIGKSVRLFTAKGVVYLALAYSFAMEVGLTLKWLYVVEIPRRIAANFNTVKAWATPLINGVRNVLTALINDLRAWITRRINEVIDAANSLKNWASNQINTIKNYLNNTVGKWFDRMTDPVKFAEWVAGAVINAALKYLYANRDKLARFILQESPAATTWLARTIEAIIGRLL